MDDAPVSDPAENYERFFVPPIGAPVAGRVVAAADPPAGAHLVDVACGTGIAARLAAERDDPPSRVVGVDPTPPMLGVARRVAPSVEWFEGPAEDLPFPDDSFDTAVCSQGLQFFTDRDQALREMHRVLVPGGRVAVGTPGPIPPLMVEFAAALRDHLGPEAAGFVQAVFALHDPDDAMSLLQGAGFEDVQTHHEDVPLRLPPATEFFWQYVSSTPLAMLVAGIDEDTRARLDGDVERRCRPLTADDGVATTCGLLMAVASTSRSG